MISFSNAERLWCVSTIFPWHLYIEIICHIRCGSWWFITAAQSALAGGIFGGWLWPWHEHEDCSPVPVLPQECRNSPRASGITQKPMCRCVWGKGCWSQGEAAHAFWSDEGALFRSTHTLGPGRKNEIITDSLNRHWVAPPGVWFQDGLSCSKAEQLQSGFEASVSPPHVLHQGWCLLDSTESWTNRAVLRFFEVLSSRNQFSARPDKHPRWHRKGQQLGKEGLWQPQLTSD